MELTGPTTSMNLRTKLMSHCRGWDQVFLIDVVQGDRNFRKIIKHVVK